MLLIVGSSPERAQPARLRTGAMTQARDFCVVLVEAVLAVEQETVNSVSMMKLRPHATALKQYTTRRHR